MQSNYFANITTGVLERILNTALKTDPGTRAQLKKYKEKTLQIEITAPEFVLFISPAEEKVSITHNYANTPSATMRGSLIDICSFYVLSASSLANSGVEITGDTAFAIALNKIFRQIDIDWEQPIVETLGVVPGHQLAELFRQFGSWSRANFSIAREQIGEYLTEELQIVPTETEITNYCLEVDSIRTDIDRLTARIDILTPKLKNHLSTGSV